MRLAATREPLWYGRDRTGSGLLCYAAAHRCRAHTAIPEHRSPAWKLAVAAAGSLSLRVDGRAIDLDGATWTVVPSGVPIRGGDGISQGLFLWIGLDPEGDGGHGLPPLLSPAERPLLRDLLAAQRGVVRGLGPDLLAAGASLFELVHARADPLLVRGATLTLAGRLRAACAAGADPRATARDRVAPALALATRCPDGRVGLDTLARACGLGRSAFGETFRAGMGMAPRAWINRERARSAARALASGAMPARAAGEHGYPSARHLSRALIQFTGRGLRAWTDSAAGGSGP